MPEPLGELIKALIKCQQEFAPLKKSATNPHFHNQFVPLHEVLQNVLPILTKNGLCVSQFPCETDDGHPGLATYLMHESGEVLNDVMPLMAAKQDPQGQGSAITYARRYALMSVLGVVGDEDDDGHAATRPAPRKAPSKAAMSATNMLDDAKESLRTAIKNAGLSKDEAAQYAWVKDSTDVEAIRDEVKALNALRAGRVL